MGEKYFGVKVRKNNFLENTFIVFCPMCTNTKTLTKLVFRAGKVYSALSSMIFGSLLGCDRTIFCKSDECSSHMMSCGLKLPGC